MTKRGAIVLHSGGLDSTVALYHATYHYGSDRVMAVHFDYGQRHRRELDQAFRICNDRGVMQITIAIADRNNKLTNDTLFAGSSQTDPYVEVPEGHYAAENMRTTVVPNRNAIMLSLAAALAQSQSYGDIIYAAHTGDHAIYPDCRPEFVAAFNGMLAESTDRDVRVVAPFIELSKSDIVRYGQALQVPFEHTYSCYKGAEVHCGVCGTCVERKEAFHLAEVVDPTVYKVSQPNWGIPIDVSDIPWN